MFKFLDNIFGHWDEEYLEPVVITAQRSIFCGPWFSVERTLPLYKKTHSKSKEVKVYIKYNSREFHYDPNAFIKHHQLVRLFDLRDLFNTTE